MAFVIDVFARYIVGWRVSRTAHAGFVLDALAETINGLFEAEVIHRCGPWRSFVAVEYVPLEWVDWFNNRRILEAIRNITPGEAEQQFYAATDYVPMAA